MIITEGIEAPFLFTADTLVTADITLGNLECPIANCGEPNEKTYAFRAPLEAAGSLAYAGFDLVSLANNHTLDYGPDALAQTLETLKAQGVQPVGAGMNAEEAYRPAFIEVDGLRIAFLAFADVSTIDYDYLAWEAGPDTPGIAWAHHDRITAGVQAAKSEADLVVVLFHNGYEIIQKVSALQQEAAHLAIDAGADLVIGSHPHVLQRMETYKDGLIFYSMGNFVFDNFLFPPNYSAILSVTLDKDGVVSYELLDVVVQLNGVPQLMEYDLGSEFPLP
jgi:poly-gamma-glutamate synthesis protein (capsule biosynthesis protein)